MPEIRFQNLTAGASSNLNIIIIIINYCAWKPDGQLFAKYNKQTFPSNAFVWSNNISIFYFYIFVQAPVAVIQHFPQLQTE